MTYFCEVELAFSSLLRIFSTLGFFVYSELSLHMRVCVAHIYTPSLPSLYVCARIFTCMYVYMHACRRVWVHVYMYTHWFTCMSVCAYIYVGRVCMCFGKQLRMCRQSLHVCDCVFTYMYICVHTGLVCMCVGACLHVHTLVYMCVCIYLHIWRPSLHVYVWVFTHV